MKSRDYMLTRTIKVIAIIFVISISLFLLFNSYLPSKIGAMGKGANKIKVQADVDSEKKAAEETKRESIATKLGVPKPITVSYRSFNPKKIDRPGKKTKNIFAIPEAIKPEVNFWRDIYSKYDKTKVVFHDKRYLDIIYSVIDVSSIVNNDKLPDEEKIERKRERVDKEILRISKILSELDNKDPNKLTNEEKTIYQLFDKVSEDNKFKKAAGSDRLRSQTGIKDKFMEGIKISGRYLGEIEKIFSEYNIPTEITRLAFVESMFNLDALSKVGASGIWQFMPDAGRLFLTINQIVDERNDPITATHAAAKHLLRDYEILNTWPLAINAYNSGRGRLAAASRKLRTNDIATIIKEFETEGYGFASRNFYPAFLAALDVFENRNRYFGPIKMEDGLSFDVIKTPFFSTLPDLAGYTGIPIEQLTTLNKQLQEDAVTGNIPLPKGFSLKVPKNLGEKFLIAIEEMNNTAKYAKWHMVQSGEDLKTIAAMYGTDIESIKKANGLKKNRVKTGQIIKLPEGILLR